MAVTWPTVADLKAAVNGLNDDADAQRRLDMAQGAISAEVGDNLMNVPAAVLAEAVIRTVAFSHRQGQHLGSDAYETRQTAVSAVRGSGARALLAPWLSLGL